MTTISSICRAFERCAILCVSFLLFPACDGGLEAPKDSRTGLAGTVRYLGGAEAWPPADSIFDVRVVAFQNYPPENILVELLGGTAFFTPDSLPYFAQESEFLIELNDPLPERIEYLVVALQNGPSATSDWLAVGVYTESGDHSEPSALRIQPGTIIDNLVINVDFANLPPQPFQ